MAVIDGGTVHFLRADHIGRPVFATNTSGAVVWTASYDPFGNVHASTGTPATIRFPG
ncbi:MAG TPA: RHS domain-containing protein [Gemmobacter sp.]|nr:RHS domain-containing protein [Gemmobacter sp.]